MQYIVTYCCKMFVYIRIGITQNNESLLRQKGIALLIGGFARFLIVLRSVQLNDQLGSGAVKVHDIPPHDLLPMNRQRQGLQKIVPKVPLLFRHLPAQLPGQRGKRRAAHLPWTLFMRWP